MGDLGFINENISEVERKILSACVKAERNPNDVTLICVSKTKPVPMLLEAYNHGCRQFGENKVQEIIQKSSEMPEDVVWHMIGHLQKNKVRKSVLHAEYIHSVDSYELACLINSEASRINKVQKILLEINIAGEESKYGLSPDSAIELVKEISLFNNIIICGLMCVAPYTDEPETNRKYFKHMHDLLLDINSLSIDNVHMDMLSMGMSGDYEVAIEEGATFVRVGTNIFGERDYSNN